MNAVDVDGVAPAPKFQVYVVACCDWLFIVNVLPTHVELGCVKFATGNDVADANVPVR